MLLKQGLAILAASASMALTASAELPYTVVDEGVAPYVSIAAPATRLAAVSVCDECVQEVVLPFSLPFFGAGLVDRVTVSANGQINMDARLDPECCTEIVAGIPDPLDSNEAAIFVVKEDLNPTAGGDIYATVLGAPGARRVVIEFRGVPFFPNAGSADAQVILHEADGAIVLHYGPAGDLGGHRFSAGIEAQSGTVGSPAIAGAFFDSRGIAAMTWPAGRRVRFNPEMQIDLRVAAIRPSLTALDPGASIDVDVEIVKFGSGALASARVDLFIDPATTPAPPDMSALSSVVALGAEPGATAVARFSGLSSATPATWELYALVNSDGAVAEFDSTNNLFGIARVFFTTVETLPFLDGFDGGLRFVIDPAQPRGGAVTPCAGSVPCEHARATIDSGVQGGCAPGSHALVLDCDSNNDWIAVGSLAIADDPGLWEPPQPSGMPSHVGAAMVRVDTTQVARIACDFSLAFIASAAHEQNVVVEFDDGRGWRIAAGAGASAGIAGNVYRPNCPAPGGCMGASTPWLCESVDLSAAATGGVVALRWRWLTRASAIGATPTAVLIDDVRIFGDPSGARLQKELPPRDVEIDAGITLTTALPFLVTAIGESHQLRSIDLRVAGTLDDVTMLGSIRLHRDEDGSRSLTPSDTLLSSATFMQDDGLITLTLPTPENFAAGMERRFVISAAVLQSAAASATVQFAITDADIRGAAMTAADLGGIPVESDRFAIAPLTLRFTQGAFSPPQPVVRRPGESGAVTAQWRVASSGSAGEWRALTLLAAGDGDDQSGISALHLIRENASSTNGRIDPGEATLATSTFDSDNGVAVFVFAAPLVMMPASTLDLLLAIDLSASAATGGMARTFEAAIAGAAAVESDATSVIVPPGGLVARLIAIDGCPLSRCGDCDVDGDVDIVDALVAAQHAVSLLTLSGNPFANCNVAGDVEPSPLATVSILDALQIARISAGLPALLTCC